MHEREVEVALSGQRVAAERHGDLLRCNFKSSRRERFHKDVGRRADSLQRGGSLRRDRVYERQRCFVRSEERPDDAAAVAPDNRSTSTWASWGPSRNGSAEWTGASVTCASDRA